MKKFMILLLSLILVASLLAGCKTTPQTEIKQTPTVAPTQQATVEPSPEKTPEATQAPTETPASATPAPTTAAPTPTPTQEPTATPVPTTAAPTQEPTTTPTAAPTQEPTASPTETPEPTAVPTTEPTSTPEPTEEPVELTKIMIMSDGTQMAELGVDGFMEAAEDFGYEPVKIIPSAMDTDTVLSAISAGVADDVELVVFSGWGFRDALPEAQNAHTGVHFVLIDNREVFNSNVTTYSFSEIHSGFIAGYAAATELYTGANFGFIGGMEIEPVQKFNWGFQQGLAAANSLLGASATISAENVVYTGSFGDEGLGANTAAQMFDNNVDCIFAAAGQLGVGVIDEARSRASGGASVWVVGVDYDQYSLGIYSGSKSVILTSAMKRYDLAVYIAVEAYHDGSLEGGTSISLTLDDDVVGIPPENPNLSSDTLSYIEGAINAYKNGTLTISEEPDGLIP